MTVSKTTDLLSSVLCLYLYLYLYPTNTKFRITVMSPTAGAPELTAAYALQDALYSQSICASYAIEIVFNKSVGAARMRVDGAP